MRTETVRHSRKVISTWFLLTSAALFAISFFTDQELHRPATLVVIAHPVFSTIGHIVYTLATRNPLREIAAKPLWLKMLLGIGASVLLRYILNPENTRTMFSVLFSGWQG